MKTSVLLLTLLSFQSIAQSDIIEGKRKINGTNLFIAIHGKGEYLLVLHGGPGLNHHYFLPHLNSLEKKFAVVYYDQRACGKSDVPSADSISIKFLVDDIEAIRTELKIEKLNILAHSWGAVLAAHYGLVHPGHIKRLILSNPSPFSREYDNQTAALLKQRTTKQDSIERSAIITVGNLDVKKYEELFLQSFRLSAYNRSNISKLKLNLPPNFIEANNVLFTALSKDKSLTINLYDELKGFQFPVLIVHGKSDLLPMVSVERLKKEIPQAKLEIFNHSGHFPFIEETEKYDQVIAGFLKKE
jgi:proline iminopeptidase